MADGYRGGVRFDGQFRTADLGTIGPDGRLIVLGRADDVIVSGGVNIHPDAVAAVLRRNLTGVAPYAVAAIAALLSAYVTLGICAAIAIFYALPSTTADADAGE